MSWWGQYLLLTPLKHVTWCYNKLAEGVKYNSAKGVFQTPRRVLYCNPLCSA